MRSLCTCLHSHLDKVAKTMRKGGRIYVKSQKDGVADGDCDSRGGLRLF